MAKGDPATEQYAYADIEHLRGAFARQIGAVARALFGRGGLLDERGDFLGMGNQQGM